MDKTTGPVPSVYQERLPHESIRLLRISTTPTGNLVGTLRVFPLKQAPHFYTASYTWGDKIYASTITTTNPKGTLKVLRNLLPFLRMVTTHRDFNDQQWWWIDSLCINQDDTKERGAQVDLMAKIYKASRSVIIWLGDTIEGESDCTHAIEFLHHLSTVFPRDPQTKHEKLQYQIRRNDLWHPDLLPQWKSLSDLFARKWFFRVWTLQEFVLPPRGRLCCGTQSINRSTFKAAFHSIYRAGITDIGTGVMYDLIPRPLFSAAYNRRRLQQLYGSPRPSSHHDHVTMARDMSLVATLAYMGNSEATDARDRVFSIRGLIAERDCKMLGKPEYTTDVSVLFRRLVVRFWREYHSLDIICFAHIFTRFATAGPTFSSAPSPLPSWTPDWRIPVPSISPVPLMASQSGNPHIGNFRPLHASAWTTSYDASGPRLREQAIAKVTFDDLTELTCWGVILCRIEQLGSLEGCETRCRSFECEEEGEHRMLRSDDRILGEDGRRFRNAMGDAEETIQALARCLTLNRKDKYFCHTAPGHYAADFVSLCREALDASGNSPSPPETGDATFAVWFDANRTLRLGNEGKTLASLMSTATVSSGWISVMDPFTSTIRSFQPHPFAEEEPSDEEGNNDDTFLSRLTDTIVKKSRRIFVGCYLQHRREGRKGAPWSVLGMAPCRARIGDAVVVLGGCSVPLVLRAKDGGEKWEVVGEAYVDGFMNGEVERLDIGGREFRIV